MILSDRSAQGLFQSDFPPCLAVLLLPPPRQFFPMSFHYFPYNELAVIAPVAPCRARSAQRAQAVQSQMQFLIISVFFNGGVTVAG